MDYDNEQKINDAASTDTKLRVKEMLHTLKRKPLLNKQLNSLSDFEIKTLLIQAYAQQPKKIILF